MWMSIVYVHCILCLISRVVDIQQYVYFIGMCKTNLLLDAVIIQSNHSHRLCVLSLRSLSTSISKSVVEILHDSMSVSFY
jgi:hypothetical protein